MPLPTSPNYNETNEKESKPPAYTDVESYPLVETNAPVVTAPPEITRPPVITSQPVITDPTVITSQPAMTSTILTSPLFSNGDDPSIRETPQPKDDGCCSDFSSCCRFYFVDCCEVDPDDRRKRERNRQFDTNNDLSQPINTNTGGAVWCCQDGGDCCGDNGDDWGGNGGDTCTDCCWVESGGDNTGGDCWGSGGDDTGGDCWGGDNGSGGSGGDYDGGDYDGGGGCDSGGGDGGGADD